jgi:serine/threonine-protein kinase ATR
MECEVIFGDLKKLSERAAPEKDSTMDLPKSLINISKTNLVMPIEENLSP